LADLTTSVGIASKIYGKGGRGRKRIKKARGINQFVLQFCAHSAATCGSALHLPQAAVSEAIGWAGQVASKIASHRDFILLGGYNLFRTKTSFDLITGVLSQFYFVFLIHFTTESRGSKAQ
jgi:hypothetical protein